MEAPSELEPAIPASVRPQINALDHAANGNGTFCRYVGYLLMKSVPTWLYIFNCFLINLIHEWILNNWKCTQTEVRTYESSKYGWKEDNKYPALNKAGIYSTL